MRSLEDFLDPEEQSLRNWDVG